MPTCPVEYPPLANLAFLLAPSGGTVAEYERWFSAAMLAATTAAAVLTTAAAALAWRSVPRGSPWPSPTRCSRSAAAPSPSTATTRSSP